MIRLSAWNGKIECVQSGGHHDEHLFVPVLFKFSICGVQTVATDGDLKWRACVFGVPWAAPVSALSPLL